jgi:UDP-N-acetylglucosamine 2-epimerase (non-hydrolysing)
MKIIHLKELQRMIKKKKILIVVGTRPNFIKVTRFKKKSNSRLEFKIVHTGQHYDEKMASSFFTQLRVEPDYFLNIKSASPNNQIAQIMLGLETVCHEYKPDVLMAVGDVNSTLAAAIFANKSNITLAHLEAGLRSNDRLMPEENNRLITDEVSDIFFVTEQSGVDNLLKENKQADRIHFVGNTMIDTLVAFEDEILRSPILNELEIKKNKYILMTMHRPSNVDTKEGLMKIIEVILHYSKEYKVVFPIHPRTRNKLKEYNIEFKNNSQIILTEPKDYFSFQKLILDCAFVITDSGGIQEETTFRGVPCYTLRPNTERPSTIIEGTNTLVPVENPEEIIRIVGKGSGKPGASVPALWDGKATDRVAHVFENILTTDSHFQKIASKS